MTFEWNDQTGNPWPGCVCNDARYELGHMQSCPAYGLTADRTSMDLPSTLLLEDAALD